MVQVDISEITEDEQNPVFQKELAAFQERFNALENDPRKKFRLCIHEAGHMVYFRRLGWTIKKLHGPYIYRDVDGKLRNILGAVSPVRGKVHDLVEAVKTDIAGFVLVEAMTGEPESKTAVSGDMSVISTFDPDVLKEVLEAATQGIIEEFDPDEGLRREVTGAAREYENEVFGSDDNWLWGWHEFRLDLPGERFSVYSNRHGFAWILIDDGGQMKLIVEGGKVCSPSDKLHRESLELLPTTSGERAADVVKRWNEKVLAAV